MRRGDKQIKIKKGLVKGRETIKRTDNYRGKTEQDWQKRKGRHGAMKLSRYEQETIVSYNAGEQTATIYTRDKAVMESICTHHNSVLLLIGHNV